MAPGVSDGQRGRPQGETSLALRPSSVSCFSLQEAILSSCHSQQDAFVTSYHLILLVWVSSFGFVAAPTFSWDRPGLPHDKARLVTSLTSDHQRASFLAASACHRGDWLMALPITACAWHLDDKAVSVRVAVALRLDMDLCGPHQCALCGSQADAWGTPAFVCKYAPGKTTRHHLLNDVIARAFGAAGVPIKKEPSGLLANDSRRPDGLTLIPWRAGNLHGTSRR